MRRFRRRKPKVQWFSPLGSALQVGDTIFATGPTTFDVPVLNNGLINSIDIGLTFDFGQESVLQSSLNQNVVTLADLQSSAWRLRRMVGNVFATRTYQGEGDSDIPVGGPIAVLFGVGAMVRTVDGTGSTLGSVDALNRDDYTDPWIWRKVWVLGQSSHVTRNAANLREGFGPVTGIGVSDTFAAFGSFPRSNTEYGYLAGSPHIDQKTNRVIGPEERLILTLTTQIVPFTQTPTAVSGVVGCFEFRYLGGLQRSSNRRNASR